MNSSGICKKKLVKKKANGIAAKKEVDPNQTTLKQLCKDLKLDPRLARRKLRDAEMKADGRWSWKTGSNDLKKVEKILTAEASE